MPTVDDENGWSEYRRLVLSRLDQLDESLKAQEKLYRAQSQLWVAELNELRVCVGKLQVKASVWGGLAGLIAAAATIAGLLLKGSP